MTFSTCRNEKKTKIKIIHIQLLPLMSGVQKVCYDELINLNCDHYERIVVCKSEGEFTAKLKNADIRVLIIPELERDISPINDVIALIKIFIFLKAENPDIVHTHSSKTGILGRFAAYFARVPAIFHTVHGFSFSGESNLLKRSLFILLELLACSITNKLIVLNQSDELIAKDKLMVQSDRLLLLPNGVDVDLYCPTTFEERYKIRNDCFNVSENNHIICCMIGRLWVQKNPRSFISAAIEVLKYKQNIRFFLIGDGELRDEIQLLINNAGYSDKIIIMGWRNDVPNLIKGVDIVVLPSRWEGLPLAIIESMATGIPVVASDIPGNNHLIENQIDGLLFPLDNYMSLASSIIKLIDDDTIRHSISTNARNKVLASYSLTHRMKILKQHYEQFILS